MLLKKTLMHQKRGYFESRSKWGRAITDGQCNRSLVACPEGLKNLKYSSIKVSRASGSDTEESIREGKLQGFILAVHDT